MKDHYKFSSLLKIVKTCCELEFSTVVLYIVFFVNEFLQWRNAFACTRVLIDEVLLTVFNSRGDHPKKGQDA